MVSRRIYCLISMNLIIWIWGTHLTNGVTHLLKLIESFILDILILPFISVKDVMLEHENGVKEHRHHTKYKLNNIESRIRSISKHRFSSPLSINNDLNEAEKSSSEVKHHIFQ